MTKKFDVLARLVQVKTEEEVKAAYVRHFDIALSTSGHVDCRTESCLFEFKLDKNMQNQKALATIMAQALYYLRRIRYGGQDDGIPAYLVLADRNEAVVTASAGWLSLCDRVDVAWDRAPSSPDPVLVQIVQSSEGFESLVVHHFGRAGEFDLFAERLRAAMGTSDTLVEQKLVTADNFESVFLQWKSRFAACFPDGTALARYFIADVRLDAVLRPNGQLVFIFPDMGKEEFSLPLGEYRSFWGQYKRPPTVKAMVSILARADRLDHLDRRRMEGRFYTPALFAGLALEEITKQLGDGWWLTHKIWDMAAGTGNLEYGIPDLRNVYMSTIDPAEVDYLTSSGLFSGAAGIFQYDYLNDDVDLLFGGADRLDDKVGWQLPRGLREDLADPENKWVVLINPPFGEATGGASGTAHKAGVSDTAVRPYVPGKAKNEMFAQFLWRIGVETPRCFLGCFGKLGHMVAPSFVDLRASWLFRPLGGFMFISRVFHGVTGKWPVTFTTWAPTDQSVMGTSFQLAIRDVDGSVIGAKTVHYAGKETLLSQYIPRAKGTIQAVPLTSAINVCTGIVREDKLAIGALGYAGASGADVQNQAVWFFLSSPHSAGNGTSIIPKTLVQAMVALAAMRAITPTWTNKSDRPLQPRRLLSATEILDCAIFNLFAGHNQTSAMKDVPYDGKKWVIENHFFPYPDSVADEGSLGPITVPQKKPAAVAAWLDRNKQHFSPEAKAVFDLGELVYRKFYREMHNLPLARFKINHPRPGWYQVRNALGSCPEIDAVKAAHQILRAKVEGWVYEVGILTREEMLQ